MPEPYLGDHHPSTLNFSLPHRLGWEFQPMYVGSGKLEGKISKIPLQRIFSQVGKFLQY